MNDDEITYYLTITLAGNVNCHDAYYMECQDMLPDGSRLDPKSVIMTLDDWIIPSYEYVVREDPNDPRHVWFIIGDVLSALPYKVNGNAMAEIEYKVRKDGE